jgi:hydrogenase maturation protein HypF
MIDQKINTRLTSSAGRFFDGISALTGVRQEVYYEGQAAIEFEMIADEHEGTYPVEIRETDNTHLVLLEPVVRAVVADLSRKVSGSIISAKFHNAVADMILQACKRARSQSGLERVVLSGGVFQNLRLLAGTVDRLESNNFKVYTHHRVPTNDGGIALGQAITANARMRQNRV